MTPENQARIEKATQELKEAFFNKLPVKFKKLHPDARTPIRATDGSAGWDLTVLTKRNIPGLHEMMLYETGIAVEIPKGYVGLLFPRSSCYKKRTTLANCVGVIDSDYRGEICFIYKNGESYSFGERCGQLLILPCPAVEFMEVEELSQTERGQGGFGSTGK